MDRISPWRWRALLACRARRIRVVPQAGPVGRPVVGAENVIVTSGRALDQTAAVIAAIPAGLAGAATPCPGWDVRALVRHLIGQDLRNFIVAARGGGRGLAGTG